MSPAKATIRHPAILSKCPHQFVSFLFFLQVISITSKLASCIIYLSFSGRLFQCAGCLLQHGEWQFVGGRLDLVLGLQVCHPLGADPVDGWDDVALGQAPAHCLAARGYLWRGQQSRSHQDHWHRFLRKHTSNWKTCAVTQTYAHVTDWRSIYEGWINSPGWVWKKKLKCNRICGFGRSFL